MPIVTPNVTTTIKIEGATITLRQDEVLKLDKILGHYYHALRRSDDFTVQARATFAQTLRGELADLLADSD